MAQSCSFVSRSRKVDPLFVFAGQTLGRCKDCGLELWFYPTVRDGPIPYGEEFDAQPASCCPRAGGDQSLRGAAALPADEDEAVQDRDEDQEAHNSGVDQCLPSRSPDIPSHLFKPTR